MIRAVLLALLGMVALEAFSRTVLLRSSKDYRRFSGYVGIGNRLIASPGYRVVFIGNSYTGEGIDEDQFGVDFARESGKPAAAAKLTADSSYAATWYYMLNRYFWGKGKAPELAVFNFQTSWLNDGKNEDIGRLALAFTTRADWPEMLSYDLQTTGDRAEYLLSTQWTTYAIRDRLRERVLSLLVPGYREYVSRVHNLNRRLARQSVQGASTYRTLGRLLRKARAAGTRLCFIAGPSLEKYDIDPGAARMIRNAEADLIDLRGIPEITAKSFRDGVHLTASGRSAYTRRVAREIAGRIAASSRLASAPNR